MRSSSESGEPGLRDLLLPGDLRGGRTEHDPAAIAIGEGGLLPEGLEEILRQNECLVGEREGPEGILG